MGQITEVNGLDLFVENGVYNFGEVGPEDVIEYSIKFLKSADDIESVQKGCGCTSAYWDDEKHAIVGTLDMSKAGPAGGYPTGETVITKYIFVWLNDGQPRFEADSKKQQRNNPQKAHLRLTLTGKVVK